MRYLIPVTYLFIFGVPLLTTTAPAPKDPMAQKVQGYFDTVFGDLKKVADKVPSPESFREDLKPLAEKTKGFYGGTLVDPDFVIREVYYKSHFLARGYDLKKVDELKGFYTKMKKTPAPQLSEPGHGGLLQPRLIAMRYPVIKDKKLIAIVSIMVRTESFLEATGLDKCKAYRITCLGKLTEESGKFTGTPAKITLNLPSTEWVIEYEE